MTARDTPGERGAHEESPRRHPARESTARTYARALPVVPVRARGLTVEGSDGHRYLDCLSGDGTLALGHNHPVVLAAIREVLDSGAPLHGLDLATPVQETFTAELVRTLPPPLAGHARVRFCCPGGTEAVEAALRLVRAATGRTGILTASPGAYGSGTAADRTDPAAGTGPAADRAAPDADPAVRALDAPEPGTPLPAGVIVEPVQAEDVSPAPDAWLRRLRELASARSVPLVVDETETGVGRTGAFWAVEHSGVIPDVMVLSKVIGGSLPLAAVVHHEALDVSAPGTETGGFRGNQLAMAAGAATLAYVRENRLAERAAVVGARILRQLRDSVGDFDWVGGVRGRGLMIGTDLVTPDPDPGVPGAPAPDLAAAVQRACLRRGLIVGIGGRHGNVVRLLPPLTISDEQTAAVLDRLTDAVAAVAREGTTVAREGTPPHPPRTAGHGP
ncbi:aminotransferase class III-fold pyridoxal phosphate-dependent enzyme [Streptomyces sp. YIM S03343]